MAMDLEYENSRRSISKHGELGIARQTKGAGRERRLIVILFVVLLVRLVFLLALEALESP